MQTPKPSIKVLDLKTKVSDKVWVWGCSRSKAAAMAFRSACPWRGTCVRDEAPPRLGAGFRA